ncbi:MAG TPA: queuosine precursor transporter [Candidatus Limnocylindrales bacterium]|nr:queuosine precursor transporter [Candidatus Limnocylindrales bacterium]
MFKIQKLDFLISLYIFCICVAELMGGKVFHLFKIGSFPLNASVAIFTLPIIFSINDIITEVYGKERARSVVRSGLVMVALIFLFVLLATNLPPSMRFQAKEQAYDTIFGLTARFAFASLTAFTIAEFMDIYVFSKIREKLGKGKLWLRTNASNIISQFIDTTIFITLAFYAVDKPFGNNFPFLAGIILPYWLLKCFMSIIETPLVYLGVRWLKKDK